ncbi:rod shape-determining protein MreD [Lentibacillus saliphilus]|uniref:rod shape-determining protein MreD n=1 Tax=Lentibacillus saliphilus TaxID=2737028 RepID=UPI001C30EC5E|nr:rod shape-determining protein MreD [Lentibacillus saliphilus]
MKRLYVPLLLFFLIVVEGIALEILPADVVAGESMIIPHWLLIALVFSSIFYDREQSWLSVGYALLFGFLFDIAYTGILGVYMFSYGVAIYVTHSLKKYLQSNIYTAMMIGTLAIIVADGIIEVIFSLVGFANISLSEYIMFRLVPTILANLLFLIASYPILKHWLMKWGSD